MIDITPEMVRAWLSYDPETGLLRWAKSRGGTIAGNIAGCLEGEGYYRIRIFGRKLLAHRIVWLLHYGEWPTGILDHINGDPTDNRIENLRAATPSMNSHNQRKAHKNNSCGLLGVSWIPKEQKFTAHISFKQKRIHLGTFVDGQAAHEAYLIAKRALHEGCTI